jgi:hypothetical protein
MPARSIYDEILNLIPESPKARFKITNSSGECGLKAIVVGWETDGGRLEIGALPRNSSRTDRRNGAPELPVI